jgi:formamidopyrimidine-DNA glycosylase
MPELPEVEALAAFLRERAVGRVVSRVDVASFTAIKTFDPPTSALLGSTLDNATRHGKFLDLDIGGLHLITHFSRAGWLHWRDNPPAAPPKPGKSPIAVRVHLAPEFESGPDAAIIAGIGNAYSDEILHLARLSPFKLAPTLNDDEVARLHEAMRTTLTDAVQRSVGQKAATLKGEKHSNLRVHARTGLPCPICGDTVKEVSFADRSFQYCPTCQTEGRTLADRRMSKLLK